MQRRWSPILQNRYSARKRRSDLEWTDCTLVRLLGANGELSGLLCLSGRSSPLDPEDRIFLESMAGHAAMALENARLFTRIEQANRHWMEIFDAITDFIVVHDQSDRGRAREPVAGCDDRGTSSGIDRREHARVAWP